MQFIHDQQFLPFVQDDGPCTDEVRGKGRHERIGLEAADQAEAVFRGVVIGETGLGRRRDERGAGDRQFQPDHTAALLPPDTQGEIQAAAKLSRIGG